MSARPARRDTRPGRPREYRRNRDLVINRARREGVERCPRCDVVLDYDQAHQPNSAEADHIVPVAQGGDHRVENLTIICRHCNIMLGDKKREAVRPVRFTTTNNIW